MTSFRYQYDNQTIVNLIDTPGFDDTNKSDYEVLVEIAAFLKKSYECSIHLNGMIYLHRISDPGMQGSSVKSLGMFKSLVGDNACKNVMLATTRWEGVVAKDAEASETELINDTRFWGILKQKGCQIRRHTNTRDSAHKLVSFFINNSQSKVVLKIQKELVLGQKELIDTAAGKISKGEIEAQLRKQREELTETKELLAQLIQAGDEALAKAIKVYEKALHEEFKKLESDYKNLRENMERQLEERSRRQSKMIEELLETSNKKQRKAEQKKVLKEAWERISFSKRERGMEHPDTLISLCSFALCLHRQSKYGEAERILRQAVTLSIKVLGAEHPNTIRTVNNLAELLKDQDEGSRQEPMSLELDTENMEYSKEYSMQSHPELSRVQADHEEVTRLLGKRRRAFFIKYSYAWTPLMWAAKEGQMVVVKLLLENDKVNINGEDKEGQTPLILAAKEGHTAIVKLLLNNCKIDVNSTDRNLWTPLVWAARNGHAAVVKLLLESDEVDVKSYGDY